MSGEDAPIYDLVVRSVMEQRQVSREVAEAEVEEWAENAGGPTDRLAYLEWQLGRALSLGIRIVIAAAILGFFVYWAVAAFDFAWDFAARL